MPAFNVGERIQSVIPVDVNATNYSWSALEIALLFFVVFMIAFAIFIVCCASSNRMGFYISVPNKHYNRWAEEDDMFDDLPTENGEQLMAMADIRKGIVVSRTRETVLEDLEDSSILQL
uniref:TMEM132D_C domain-containing protein n=1 Tax=Caenorhabditis tropicalis TaxID=1561998 RepID=A0A1I7URP2_9PELO